MHLRFSAFCGFRRRPYDLPVDGIKLHRGNFAAIGQQIQPLLMRGNVSARKSNLAREAQPVSKHFFICGWLKSANT
jgi:hypothetical protein